ncbi:MAG: hypothetical protein NVSMB22_09410 [Chloroflexota bacterium]
MAVILAIVLGFAGVCAFAAYNGTSHFYNGSGCGPIDILGYTFAVDIDCVTTSRAELLMGVVCLTLAVFVIIFGRGGSEHRRW